VGMKHTGIDPDAFNAFEAAGWEKRAADYDRFSARSRAGWWSRCSMQRR
jgi:hypothetical protein